MKLRYLKILLLVFCLGVFWGVERHVSAQQQVAFESLQIDLWPEYDQPGVLVVYRFRLSPQVQLPVDLAIQIPAIAGTPNAVAEKRDGGVLLNVQYSVILQGEWNYLYFKAEQPVVQIEYYDPSLKTDGEKRSYVYHWPGGYDIDQVTVFVQQPIGAKGMQIMPRLNDVTQGEKGITYYSDKLGSFKANETFERSIRYEKDSESLTIEFLEIDSPIVDENTTGRVSLVNIIPWGVGLLGVIVIVAGVYWYWATEKKPIRISKHKVRQPKEAKVEIKPPQQNIYCHQCGKRAEGGDKFCRTCGTKLRI